MQFGGVFLKIRALEVTKLNEYIKIILNDDPILSNVKVRGEVSNFKEHSSGNVYLSLKDEKSKINCMIYKNNFDKNLNLANGKKIIAEGFISSYVRDGVYQLYIKKIEIEGQGKLHIEFLKLKEKLQKEGLFEEKYKKQIATFPRSIGVITSPTGAVIKDIINVVKRRFPKVNIKLYPALVQGEASVASLVEAVEFFNEKHEVDTIIIGRGGGSLEELWSFNEEKLARAIFASKIPVISAVGHETDFTICDFVADMRAPTPSAAAELATPNLKDLIENQNNMLKIMERYVNNSIKYNKQRLDSNYHRYSLFYEREMFDDRYMNLDINKEKLDSLMENIIRKEKEQLNFFSKAMANLNPFSVLERGYSITQKDGLVISSKENLEIGDRIDLILKDGKVKCELLEK